jgi:cob(I)alamin adenosyltransferase
MSIYTKKGDQGETCLINGKNISKAELKLQVIGTIDELGSSLGATRSFLTSDNKLINIDTLLLGIQKILLVIGSELAGSDLKLDRSPTKNLERAIDHFEKQLPELNHFIIFSGSKSASLCQLSRSICRRAERMITALNQEEPINPHILIFFNRLSDFLFVVARQINQIEGFREEIWQAY